MNIAKNSCDVTFGVSHRHLTICNVRVVDGQQELIAADQLLLPFNVVLNDRPHERLSVCFLCLVSTS